MMNSMKSEQRSKMLHALKVKEKAKIAARSPATCPMRRPRTRWKLYSNNPKMIAELERISNLSRGALAMIHNMDDKTK
jgi:hypothetical protein